MAPEDVRDDLAARSSIDRGRRRLGYAEPTTTRDVEAKTWALARHGLAESATSIARHPWRGAWTMHEGPATNERRINSGEGSG